MDKAIIVGNAIAFISAMIMVLAGLMQNKKKIILTETIHIALAVVSDLVLGGITGAIVNLVSMLRNYLCYKDKLNTPLKIIIIVVASVLTIWFNNLGLIGYLPLISIITYTYFIDLKDVIKFKYIVIFSLALWCIYDFTIHSNIFLLFDILSILSNIVAIIKIKNKKRGKNYDR